MQTMSKTVIKTNIFRIQNESSWMTRWCYWWITHMAPLSKAAFNLIKRLGNFWIFLKHEMSYQRKGQILILITTSNCTSLKILPVFGQFCFRSIRTNLELTFINYVKLLLCRSHFYCLFLLFLSLLLLFLLFCYCFYLCHCY